MGDSPGLAVVRFLAAVIVVVLPLVSPAAADPFAPYSPSRHCPIGKLECLSAVKSFASGDEAVLSRVSQACVRCHISCAECHPSNRSGTIVRGAGLTGGVEACLGCHAGWGAFPERDTKVIGNYIHLSSGMTCRSCHQVMEVNSTTGSVCASRKASCESCHAGTVQSPRHQAYGHDGRLSCLACHGAGVRASTVMNITRFASGGRPETAAMEGECLFLINRDGKVVPANLRCFHDGIETYVLLFYPMSNHAIRPVGRACLDCHASPAADDLRAGRIWVVGKRPSGEAMVRIIPVSSGIEYLVGQPGSAGAERTSSRAIALMTIDGTPLDREQLDQLLTPWR